MKRLIITCLAFFAFNQPVQSLAQALPGADDAYQKLKAKADKRFPSSTLKFSSVYECNEPEAKKLSKYDNGGYARMFFAALCECKKGVSSPQREKQLVAQMKSMKHAYNNAMSSGTPPLQTIARKSCPKVSSSARGSSTSGASEELRRQAEIQQLIQNFQTAYGIQQKALNRSRQTSRELSRLANIVNTGDPFEIANNFNQIMNQIEQINENLRQSINIGYVEDATTIVSQYSSGNLEGALASGLTTLGTIGTNEEAKREVERKRQEAISQKNNAMRKAANDMIDANNNALQKYMELLALCVEEDRELFYLKKAIFHSSYANSIENNFSYSNTNWANNPYKPVEKPVFRTYYNPMHEQHYEAAIRKKKLFEEYKNKKLLEGAKQHISAAIDLQPKNTKYYLELARIAYPNDMVLSSLNYLSAYGMSPEMFDSDLRSEMFNILKSAGMQAASAIDNNNTALARDYLDADLFEIIEMDGSNMFSYAAKSDATASLDLIYNRQILKENKSKQRKYVHEAIAMAAKFNSTNTLTYLLKQGYNVDFYFKGKRPIDYAAAGNADEAFLICLNNSTQKVANLKKYESSLIYIKSMAYENPQNASQGLCKMGRKKQTETIKILIEEALQNTIYLNIIKHCPEAFAISKKNEEIGAELNQLFDNSSRMSEKAKLSHQLLVNELVDIKYLQSNKEKFSTALIRSDQLEAFKVFKSQGLLSSKNANGMPLCFEFIKYGSRILASGVVKDLDFNVKDANGAGILHNLAFVSSTPNAAVLINNCGIDINQKGPYGWTPLHFAVREANNELASMLVFSGANKNARDEWNRKPIKIAKERELENIKNLLK